jgi:ELWxxDGT repeat protein
MKGRARRLAGAGLTTALAIIFLFAFQADAVELVADLNTSATARPVYAGNRALDTPMGSFLPMEDSSHGTELWFSDNTPRGTRLLKDIYPGFVSSAPVNLYQVGDTTVFFANDGVHGVEPWRTDGTTAGTYMLADIGPGRQSHGSGTLAVVLDGVLYFAADDGVTGSELWRTDGTREGTYLVIDLVPGYGGSYPTTLRIIANQLFFKRQDDIWVSDGTAAGTRLFVGMQASMPVAAGSKLFFSANDLIHGRELWRSDPDGDNMEMVANLNQEFLYTQELSSDPAIWFARGNSVIFTARPPDPERQGSGSARCRMYRADAEGSGVTELLIFEPHQCGSADPPINLPAGALFSLAAATASEDPELWVTDGTTTGTVPLGLPIYYSAKDPHPVRVAYGQSGEAYFFARANPQGATAFPDKVWRTDGTRTGTYVFADLTTYSQNHEIAYLNGRVYFDSGHGTQAPLDELWTSDGTPAGTYMVRDINPVVGSSITNLRASNGALQFFATGVGTGLEPWTSDGTFDGTINLIEGIVGGHGSTGDSNVVFAGQLGARVVFAADRGPGAIGREMHITDGTTAGTSLIRDINIGATADPDNFLVMGNQVLFVARDWGDGRELWSTDGTSGGTIQLADVVAGDGNGNVTLGGPGTIINGVAYFTAGPSTTSPDLWRSDGTVAGTFEVPGNVGQRISILGGNGTHLLYQALNNMTMHLWAWDGSQAHVISAADNLKITASSGVTFAGRVCFRAWDVSPQALDVWCANGLAGDLLRATDFSALGATAGDLQPLNDTLLINVPGATASSGLYATDGGAGSTQRISAERIANAKPFGDQQIVFASESGRLMLTDGTGAGTRDMLQGVNLPGEFAGDFGVLGNYVVFIVNDANRGAVVWRTDGTPAGTRFLADLDTGTAPASAGSGQFHALGNRLLFSAYRTSIGNELWSINAMDPNASDDVAFATGGTAVSVNVLDNDADFDGTLNSASVAIVTQPTHGTAAVDTATGAISYTGTTTYSGSDTLTYRVADDQGRQSNVATVSIQVTAGASPPPTPPPTPPPAPPPSNGGGGGGGGAIGLEIWALLLLVALNAGRRWRSRDSRGG